MRSKSSQSLESTGSENVGRGTGKSDLFLISFRMVIALRGGFSCDVIVYGTEPSAPTLMFQPRGPNFFLSWIMAWKKQIPNTSFRHVTPRTKEYIEMNQSKKQQESC